MKTNINKLFAGMFCAACLFSTTSCIDETFPTDSATAEQLAASDKATEAMVWAMPAFLNDFETVAGNHYEWGYGSIMHIRDVMTGDMTVVATGYDWYSNWAANKNQGENSANTQFIWNYYWKFVQTHNNVIRTINPESATDNQLGMLGAAQAYRALAYLDLAQMYEFLPNDVTTGVKSDTIDVTYYTVPIVDENTTEDMSRYNPRVHRDSMAMFILNDLNNAEKNIVHLSITDKVLPHLDVVYGLKARLYMWIGDYENAKTYARLAIDNNTGHVMSQSECLDTKAGFNTADPWMLASITMKEDAVVKSGILNWASWMSPEAQYGYNAAGATSMIDAAMYNRISNGDFRKLMYKAPEGHALEAKVPYIDAVWAAELPEYAAIKFRPNGGDTQAYAVGSSTAYPLMRVEEMYFIEAEAAEHLAPGEGIELLTDFMTTYRNPDYVVAPGVEAIDEIVFQKRVELWGEGLAFYDIKRLDMSVTRGYEGSNHDAQRQFNTDGRPAWMNYCIVITEKNNNLAIEGWENPDPTGKYTPWTGN
ncbi:MAG: RagB/SusD family nutrient uptake outer membrane protein [Bacteroidales bacterium]|nr:RagB/SusD family nutrient uptake outer membrane protein [Bacteroidales bacterium]